MSTIPFIEALFFDPKEGRIELETRFMRHLRKLRCRRIPPDLPPPPDEIDAPGEISDADLMGSLSNLRLCYWLTRAHVDFGCAPADRFEKDDAAIVAAFKRYIEPVRHG